MPLRILVALLVGLAVGQGLLSAPAPLLRYPFTFKGHTSSVRAVAFSPDGKTLASGSTDKTIKLWNVMTGKEKATLTGHTSEVIALAYRPDGQMLYSLSLDRTIKLWGPKAGK